MPCLLGCLAVLTPRIVIVLLVIFSDYIGAAYQTVIWPLLGFVFFPTTTLAYAWAINSNGSVQGIYLIVVVIAVMFDLGATGSSSHASYRYRVRVVKEKD